MSHLASLLRQITKKSSHPNALIHKVQLERAKLKYLVQGQLDNAEESTIALGAPEEEEQEQERRKAVFVMEGGNRSEPAKQKVKKSKRGLLKPLLPLQLPHPPQAPQDRLRLPRVPQRRLLQAPKHSLLRPQVPQHQPSRHAPH